MRASSDWRPGSAPSGPAPLSLEEPVPLEDPLSCPLRRIAEPTAAPAAIGAPTTAAGPASARFAPSFGLVLRS